MKRDRSVLVVAVLAPLGAALLASAVQAAPPKRAPLPPRYVEECGSCHVAYPPRFLGRRSWQAVLAGLADHFGVDAQVEPQTLRELQAFVLAGARERETLADGRPALRISEAAWFRHEHPRPGASVWSHPDVKSPANCAACHREAESGSYAERSLRVPRKGASR
jgi:hypothetical protein